MHMHSDSPVPLRSSAQEANQQVCRSPVPGPHSRVLAIAVSVMRASLYACSHVRMRCRDASLQGRCVPRKSIRATAEEVEANPRSRSASLRVFVKAP